MGSNLEEGADLISSLGNDNLCRIISRLSLKSAVQTSVLSKRWRPLWNEALSLDRTIGDIEKVVIAFLNENDQLSNHSRLQYNCSQGGSLKVTIEDNKELHFDFDAEHDFQEHFDWELQCPKQSEEPIFSTDEEPSPLHRFPVRILQVKSVSKLTNEPLSSLISNFRLLESLTIAECEGLQSFNIRGGPQFQNFTILNCPKLNEVLIIAFNLQTLKFQGLLPKFSLFGLNLQLKDVMLDFRGGPADDSFYRENFCSFLQGIRKVEFLTLCGWPFQVSIPVWLGKAGFRQDPDDFMFLNLKELQWIDSSMKENRLEVLISFLKFCPLLEKLLIIIDPTSYVNPYDEECDSQEWNLNEEGNHRRLDRLRIVELEGCVDQKDEYLFVEYLLENDLVSTVPRITGNPHNSGLSTNCEKTHQPTSLQTFDSGETSSSSGYEYQDRTNSFHGSRQYFWY